MKDGVQMGKRGMRREEGRWREYWEIQLNCGGYFWDELKTHDNGNAKESMNMTLAMSLSNGGYW